MLLVKEHVKPDDPAYDPHDYTVIACPDGSRWVEVGGTAPFEADPSQAESLRAGLGDFIQGAGVELG
jgi:hypothetical protein